jgi:feruloyl esterase
MRPRLPLLSSVLWLVVALAPADLQAADPAVIVTAPAAASTGADACAALRGAAGGYAIADAATVVPAPEWVTPPTYGRSTSVRVPFCRVQGLIAGRIGFELWLPPAARWNGRLLGAGVGGDAGFYNYQDMARGIAAGYATVTNDSGHKQTEANWMMRSEAVQDYTHRSQHLMNVTARALIAVYYGKAPHHAYFVGCSGGGRQALKEMQRFPGDYDGVIAGAGAPTMPVMSARHLWQALYQQRNPAGALTDQAWDLVAKAAVARCDTDDGVADGVVENPASCKFDVRALQCHGDKATECLSAAQVQTVSLFSAPLRDQTGRELDLGLVPGVRTRPGPPSPLLLPLFAQGAHQDLGWRAEQFNMRDDLALIDRMMPEMRADDPDLRAFAAHGGRAILYQGWLDPSVVAGQSIGYYQHVRTTMGAVAADQVMQLYMVPGMLHCGGGEGADRFGGASDPRPVGDADHDLLTALTQWVEQGKAPIQIKAARLAGGQVTREHLLCPYPQQAIFLGGDSHDLERYQCSAGKTRGQ